MDVVHTTGPRVIDASPLPAELRLGFDLFTRSAFGYCSAGRACAQVFWGADEKSRCSALSNAIDQDHQVFAGYSACLPSRYGHNKVLDAAMNCLLSTLGSLFRNGLHYDKSSDARRYVIALGLLQNSITVCHADPTLDADMTVAAIMLLTVYESINGSVISSWSTHIAGLASLYTIRGPSRVTSTLETLVLLASVGGFIAEAFNNNHPCFLQEPEWQSFLSRSVASVTGATPNLEPTQTFLSVWCQMPGLVYDCQQILEQDCFHDAEEFARLAQKAIKLRSVLIEICPPSPPQLLNPKKRMWYVFDEEEQDMGNYSNFVMMLAICDRVILALEGGSTNLEFEAYDKAQEVIDLHEAILSTDVYDGAVCNIDPGPRNRIMYIRYAFAIVQTHSIFLQHSGSAPLHGCVSGTLDKDAFEVFHNKIRGLHLV